MKTTISMLVVLAAVAAAPPLRAEERNFDRVLEVSPGGRLTIDSDGADVSVTGGDSKQVAVHISAKGSSSTLDNLNLSAEKTADGVAVIAKRKSKLSGLFSFSS